MPNEIRSIATLGESFQETKNSKFHGYAARVCDETEAATEIAAAKARHPGASAHAYAYIIGQNNETMKFHDGGEPGGTAGLPMMEVIKKQGLTDVICIVSRYYGGTHLGAGGLARAFGLTCATALGNAEIKILKPATEYRFTLPYPMHGKAAHWLEHSPFALLNTDFAAEITLLVRVFATDDEAFKQQLSELTNGVAAPESINEGYY